MKARTTLEWSFLDCPIAIEFSGEFKWPLVDMAAKASARKDLLRMLTRSMTSVRGMDVPEQVEQINVSE
jgi:hypothetical protein